MKTYRLIFSTKLKNRLTSITEYVFESSKSAEIAKKHINSVKSSIQILKTFPLFGREAMEFGADIRKLVVLDYTLLYSINESEERIEILNIFRENLP